MLKYKIISEDNEMIIYRYYPEGREEFGEIFVNKKEKIFDIIKIPYVDRYKIYAFHMIDKIEEFIKNNSFKESGMIAWY